ncbi:MAG TPA: hypothetical protein VKP88_04290 [Candidatus Paceibacterota bacterium]|nr:hypothetical protein [Candidatus Paceibacterota bacterium]
MEVTMRRTHYQRGLAIVTKTEVERSFEEWVPCEQNGYVRLLDSEELPPEADTALLHFGFFDAEGVLRGHHPDSMQLVELAADEGFLTHPLH